MPPTILALALLAAGSAPSAPPAHPRAQEVPPAKLPTGAVLVLDGEPVSAEAYGSWLVRVAGESMLETYALSWLIEREARRLGVTVTPEEVDAEIEREIQQRVQTAFGGDHASWVAELALDDRTEGGYRRWRSFEVRPQLLATRIASADRRIPEWVLQRHFEDVYGPGGRTVDFRVIRLELERPRPRPGSTLAENKAALDAAKERLRERLAVVRDRIVAGDEFGVVARELSTHEESRHLEGVLPDGYAPGDWSFEVNQLLQTLGPGELSPPVVSMNAGWLFQVDQVRQHDYEAERDALLAELEEGPPVAAEIEALVERLREPARVEPVVEALYGHPPEGASVRPADEVLARIDGVPVRRAEYTRWLMHNLGETLARLYVDSVVVAREAREAEFAISPEEVRRRTEADVERVVEHYFDGDRDAWRQEVLGSHRTEDGHLRQLAVRNETRYLAEMLCVRDREVTDQQVRGEWLRLYGEGGRSIEARMIKLVVPALIPASMRGVDPETRELIQAAYAETRERADEILERLDEGEDFGSLASKFSDDPETRMRAGRLDGAMRAEDWPEEVFIGLRGLLPGQVSEPIEALNSLLLFEILDTREVPLESVADEIREELAAARPGEPELAAYRNVLTRDVELEILPAMYR